jgi:hypothetical protein
MTPGIGGGDGVGLAWPDVSDDPPQEMRAVSAVAVVVIASTGRLTP